MKTMKIQQKSYEAVVDEKQKATIVENCMRVADDVNRYVGTLASREDFLHIDSVELLTEVSPNWLKRLIDSNTEHFFATLHIPNAMKQDYTAKFNEVYEQNKGLAEAIYKAVHTYKEIRWEMDASRMFALNEEDVEAYATSQATIHLGKAAQEYYTMLADLISKLNEVSTWEREHNFTPFILNGSVAFAQGVMFNEPWSTSFLKHDHWEIDLQKFLEIYKSGLIGEKRTL
jgi:hypothetical protein